MPWTDDPAAMSPPERRREIASILARGVLRLRRGPENRSDPAESRTAEKDPESGRDWLDGGRSRHSGSRPRVQERRPAERAVPADAIAYAWRSHTAKTGPLLDRAAGGRDLSPTAMRPDDEDHSPRRRSQQYPPPAWRTNRRPSISGYIRAWW